MFRTTAKGPQRYYLMNAKPQESFSAAIRSQSSEGLNWDSVAHLLARSLCRQNGSASRSEEGKPTEQMLFPVNWWSGGQQTQEDHGGRSRGGEGFIPSGHLCL